MPPVSSRTTSRLVPSLRSRLSGLASSSAGLGRTGRRLANRPRPLRRPRSPCSGRGAPGSVVSHFGPPTAPSNTASALRHASRTSSVSALPCSSIEAPPTTCSVNSNSPSASSSRLAAPTISGPIPSPGRRTMRRRRSAAVTRRGLHHWTSTGYASPYSSSIRPAGRNVQPHVVEDKRARDVSQNGVQVLLVQALRKPFQVGAQADDPQEFARLPRLLGTVPQPTPHVLESSGLQPELRVTRRGEIPGAGDAADVRRDPLVPVHVLERVQELVEVPDPAALCLELAAGPHGGVEPDEQTPVVENPVKRGVGEHRVDRIFKFDVE